MDINKENNLTEETVSEETQELVSEIEETEVCETVAETEEVSEEETSTLSVNTEDIDEELMRYGISSDEETQQMPEEISEVPEKKRTIQKPVIIAAVAFLLTAVLVFGVYFVYNTFFQKGIDGVWTPADAEVEMMYLVFDEGKVSMKYGNVESYGYYETEEVNGFDVVKTNFYELAQIGGTIVITYPENSDNVTFNFLSDTVDITTLDKDTVDFSTIANLSLDFKKADLPESQIDPANITHASADELGITALNIDEDILGSWRLQLEYVADKYQTYTFNADGTGSYNIDYYEMEGVGMGRIIEFKYTVYDGEILITIDDGSGTNADDSVPYYLDKNNLVMFGIGFEKVN